jgi:hypothetical protein
MDAVLAWKSPGLPGVLKFERCPPLKSSAGAFGIGFQQQGSQAALGQVQGGGQPGHTRSDNKDLMGANLISQDYGLVIGRPQPGT